MMKHPQISAGWIGGLALVLVALLATPSFAQDAKASGPYHVSLQAPNLIRQYEQVELTATVTDIQGRPVNGVPVVFSVESDWRSNASVVPRRITTQDGVADTLFQANMTGPVTVTAQAGGAYDSAEITISGAGSAPHLSRNSAEKRRGPWSD
jgi:hypothetical protein